MTLAREILEAALKHNQKALSEFDSKRLLSIYGIPVARGAIARDWNETRKAASSIGYPVVLKFCSPEVTHKTEKNLIEIDIRDEKGLHEAFQRMSKQPKYTRKIHAEYLIKILERSDTCNLCPFSEWKEENQYNYLTCHSSTTKAKKGQEYICRSFINVAGSQNNVCPCRILGPEEAAKRSWIALEKWGYI